MGESLTSPLSAIKVQKGAKYSTAVAPPLNVIIGKFDLCNVLRIPKPSPDLESYEGFCLDLKYMWGLFTK